MTMGPRRRKRAEPMIVALGYSLHFTSSLHPWIMWGTRDRNLTAYDPRRNYHEFTGMIATIRHDRLSP